METSRISRYQDILFVSALISPQPQMCPLSPTHLPSPTWKPKMYSLSFTHLPSPTWPVLPWMVPARKGGQYTAVLAVTQ